MKIKTFVIILISIITLNGKEATTYREALDETSHAKEIGTWSHCASNYTSGRGINFMHAVDEDVFWSSAYEGSGKGNIQEFGRSIDGGETWSSGEITSCSGGQIGMISGISSTKAYTVVYSSNIQGIYATEDGGESWSRQETADFNLSSSFPNIVHFFNETDGVCQGDPVDGYYEIYTTNDAGETWSRVPSENIPAPISGEYGVAGYFDSIEDNIWFGTLKGRVFRSSDKGATWDVSNTGLPDYVDITFRDELYGLAIDKSSNSDGRLFKTEDGGITWSEINTSGYVFSSDIEFIPETNTVVSTGSASNAAGATYSFDGGVNWNLWSDIFGVQMLATDWASSKSGFSGGFSSPDDNRGIFKYEGDLVTNIEGNYELQITNYELKQNYPNPFNPATKINYELGITNYELAEIVVHNSVGQEVWSSNPLSLNTNTCLFDGSKFNSGIYYYSLLVDKKIISTKSMVLIK